MVDAVDSTDDTVQDDPVEQTGPPPSLDQVHAISQAQVETEDENAGNDTGEEDEGTVPEAEPEAAPEAGTEPVAEPEPEADLAPAPPVPAEPAAQLDSDITKNAAGKVAVKDAEGKTFYFNNIDEVPNDFEPASYKELMTAVSALDRKATADEAKATSDAQAAEEQAEAEATKQRVDAMNKSWDNDIAALIDTGALPKDETKLEAAKEEVFSYIDEQLKQNNVITSFNQAYKSMMYDRQQAKAADKQKEIDAAKKQRGSIVQPGSGNSPDAGTGGSRGKVIEAPPQGVGLDAVHARAVNSL